MKQILSFLFYLLVVAIVAATIIPKHVLFNVKERVLAESNGLMLVKFKEIRIVEDIQDFGYLSRYRDIAIKNMRDYGIPASITLAQALLESNGGKSPLATESKNHFGIKCNRKCLGCLCKNYGDDTIYDMFRVFESAEESFEEHARLLKKWQRYAKLFRCEDYKCWAYGLKSAGYATDPDYAEKLIQIIESNNLTKYDDP